MSSYPELAPPDIDVIVETTTVSPTIYVPTLPTCIVGPCYQIVEVTEDGAANSAALLNLPAVIASDTDAAGGPPATYTIPAAPNNYFKMKISGGAEYTYTLTATGQTPAFLAAEINAAFVTNSLDSAAVAEVIVGSAAGKVRLQIRTKATGPAKTVMITGGGVGCLTAMGLPGAWTARGYAAYSQERIKASPYLFPMPSGRDNLDQLTFDPTNVTVAIDEGGTSLRALSADSAIERFGVCDPTDLTAANKIYDDGDADGYSNRIQLTDAEVDDEWGNTNVAVADISAAATAASVTGVGNVAIAGIDGLTLIMSVSGSPWQTITFTGVLAEVDVLNQINAVFPGLATGAVGPAPLVLATTNVGNGLATIGREAYINIHKNSTALLKLDPSGTRIFADTIKVNIVADLGNGDWFPVAVNDEFYLNGVLQGYVTQILASAPASCQFEISEKLAEADLKGKTFYFKSKGVPGAAIAATRPTPEVYVTTDGEVHIKNTILREATGKPIWKLFDGTNGPMFYGTASIYLGYKALRKDVSPAATTPELLSFDNTTQIETQIGPISTDNPLAMACYLAKVNCPGRTLYAQGIEAVSDTDVYGTSLAYSSAMDFMAGYDVYTIVPLTQDLSILQNWKTHVEAYSARTKRLERCCFGTTALPTRRPNTAMASGTDGNNPSVTKFNTNIAGLTALLLAAGIDPTVADMTLPDLGVYLNIETDALNYHVKSVSGTEITIQTEAAHAFYSASDFTGLTLLNEAFSVMLRGAAVISKTAISEALADIGNSFNSKRMIIGAPGEVGISDGSLLMRVPSFYAAAVEGGKACQLLPNTGFTNTVAPGIEDVYLSNPYFNATQMNVAAAGGIWWWFKPTPNSAVKCRHQLTTLTTSIEEREWSLQKPLDFLAKMIRMMIRPLLGQYNITDDLRRYVKMMLQGVAEELVEKKKTFTTLEFGAVLDVEDAPDSLDVVVDTVRVYPFNKLTTRIRV